jgi:hypothetical protein
VLPHAIAVSDRVAATATEPAANAVNSSLPVVGSASGRGLVVDEALVAYWGRHSLRGRRCGETVRAELEL